METIGRELFDGLGVQGFRVASLCVALTLNPCHRGLSLRRKRQKTPKPLGLCVAILAKVGVFEVTSGFFGLQTPSMDQTIDPRPSDHRLLCLGFP